MIVFFKNSENESCPQGSDTWVKEKGYVNSSNKMWVSRAFISQLVEAKTQPNSRPGSGYPAGEGGRIIGARRVKDRFSLYIPTLSP